MKASIFVLTAGLVALWGCARAPVKDISRSMRPTSAPQIRDDESWETLLKGLKVQIEYWSEKDPEEEVRFGPRTLKVSEYLAALQDLLRHSASKQDLISALESDFEFYEVYGGDKWGEVFVTGYFEPVIQGALKPGESLTQPLYKIPPDLVNVDMSAYAETFPHWSPFQTWASEQKSAPGLIRGRLVPPGKGENLAKVIPYFDRREIDSEKALKGQSLELVYVDPLEAFFLQIQGSGEIHLKGGKKMRLGYAAQNGHPYVPIGKYLTEVIPLEKMSLQKIEAYMREILLPEQRQELMNKNPSYVFFTPLEGPALTYAGTEVINGRTIATDWRYFPKGALAYLEFEKPRYEGEELQFEKTGRLVFDQDTGGAIRGTHRVDLFCGQGEAAKQMAGVMKHPGTLKYMVPKQKAARLSFMKSGLNGRE